MRLMSEERKNQINVMVVGAAYVFLGLVAFVGIGVLAWEILIDLVFLSWVGIDRFTIEVILKDPYLWLGIILSTGTIYGLIKGRQYQKRRYLS